MSHMDRRRFLVMLGMAPVVVAAAKYLPAAGVPFATPPPTPTTQTVSFTGSHSYKPGDIITITGFKYSKYPNGTYRCVSAGEFVPHAV
jgi:hypothetical protein